MKAVITNVDMITPYGRGAELCMEGLLSGDSAISNVSRFNTESFNSHRAGFCPGLDPELPESLVWQMLEPMLNSMASSAPDDSTVITATTAGEIDLLEKSVINGSRKADDSRPDKLLSSVCRAAEIHGDGMVISAACASSTTALARAASLIQRGKAESVLVAACDSVSEFVFSGFSALMALDPEQASPFDRNRRGLTPGEAAGLVLLMSEERARRENRRILCELAGWGMTNDANHMTGPSRDGQALASAITAAMDGAGAAPDTIDAICAHGTGTVYNDAMEMKAFDLVFDSIPVPAFSVKGAIGHTMGAAGLIETVISIKSLEKKCVPPTIGTQAIDDDAALRIRKEVLPLNEPKTVLSTNSGFGGVNAALLIRKG